MKKKTIWIIIVAVIAAGCIVLLYTLKKKKKPEPRFDLVPAAELPEEVYKDEPVFDPKGDILKIEYLGYTFKVDKENPEFTENQIEQMEMLIENYRIPQKYDSLTAVWEVSNALEIPGHGCISGGYGDSTVLGHFTFFGIELPTPGKGFLMCIFHADSLKGKWELFDRFIYKFSDPPQITFKVNGRTVTYYHENIGMKVMGSKDFNTRLR